MAAVVDRVDSADVGEMREALAAMRASDQSSREFQLAHWDFHRVILRRCPTGFQTMIESQLTQIDRHQRLYFSRAVAVSDMTATDAKFLDAVEAGDADAARDILTFHLLDIALGVIATQDPGHRFCTLPIAVRGQAIGLEGLDELGGGAACADLLVRVPGRRRPRTPDHAPAGRLRVWATQVHAGPKRVGP
ncbi:FCD domain-containing protein [Gordonia paraffinivorans]|uniref:FCD domain-containing protein n=1 Tax=Gordonia paraffinivorans TaxID=175628 RepID=UPI001C92C4D6|nr:FCD domain-containing protein [Gordonia paraffinivorans]